MDSANAISLHELARRLGAAISEAAICDVWVTAETSDLRCSGGHCYMELIQKDPQSGAIVARLRAAIWASRFGSLNTEFRMATGTPLASDIKIMARVTASYHPVYGLSLVINDINPDYTVGDLLRRRREILQRLTEEGVADMNRQLEWPLPVQRIAVISAAGAAGYGDFINQLYHNSRRLRFHTELFSAILQGTKAPASIIEALDRIAPRIDNFDCVVIIRGGGATSDLASFDDYDLAANVAQFPLPIIVGVGHERDITVLDYVANMRVKTPTAAAEWLIGQGNTQLQRLQQLGAELFRNISDRLGGNRRQLAYIEGQLAPLVRGRMARELQRLDNLGSLLPDISDGILQQHRRKLDSLGQLIEALSPEATLRRGYTITRLDGRALTSPDGLAKGRVITTTFAGGTAESVIS